MKKRNHYSISYCICPACKNPFPIPRISGQSREKDHLKDIWCPFCKETQTMREVRDCDFV